MVLVDHCLHATSSSYSPPPLSFLFPHSCSLFSLSPLFCFSPLLTPSLNYSLLFSLLRLILFPLSFIYLPLSSLFICLPLPSLFLLLSSHPSFLSILRRSLPLPHFFLLYSFPYSSSIALSYPLSYFILHIHLSSCFNPSLIFSFPLCLPLPSCLHYSSSLFLSSYPLPYFLPSSSSLFLFAYSLPYSLPSSSSLSSSFSLTLFPILFPLPLLSSFSLTLFPILFPLPLPSFLFFLLFLFRSLLRITFCPELSFLLLPFHLLFFSISTILFDPFTFFYFYF